MRATFRPITWTGPRTPPAARRSRYVFKAPWADTLNLLDRELTHLGASEVIIEADFTESDIRLDGMPYANARTPTFPGIRIAFESKHGPLIYQTDICEFWQHNVRSIALGLEALRAVDRYGITARAEQYTGWKALPSGTEPGMTVDDAWSILGSFGDTPIREQRRQGDGRTQFRRARAFAHPDRHDGDRALWDQVETAGRVLGLTS